jgi:hypothetical protein
MDPDAWTRRADLLMVVAFVLALLLVLGVAWRAASLLWVIPVLLAGGLVASWLVRDELRVLLALIVGFVTVVDYQQGVEPQEVVYGLLFYGYLAWWFVSRLWIYRDDILATWLDRVVFLFLVWITLSLGLTILLRGDLAGGINEWLSVLALAYYFPVKEVIIRRRSTVPIQLAAGAVALFIAIRNILEYGVKITTAETLWQIAGGRVVQNEHLLMLAGLFCFVYLLFLQRRGIRMLVLMGLLVFTAGVVIGLSRSLWVSYALGGLVIFFLVDRRKRLLLLGSGLAGLVAVLVIGSVAFPGLRDLVLWGLLDRLFSLRTATTEDISLVNRFIESGAAWTYIKANPIVGYGFGVPYKYYSLVYELDFQTTFVHNGYLGIWYRHGLVGAGMLMTFYFATLARGIRLARSVVWQHAAVGIAVAACLLATTLHTTVANPFATSEKTFFLGILAGLVSGVLALDPVQASAAEVGVSVSGAADADGDAAAPPRPRLAGR